MKLTFGPLSPSDIPGFQHLVRTLFPRSRGRFSPDDLVWVAKIGELIMGFVRFSRQKNRRVLNGIGVLTTFRNRGIGSLLLEQAIRGFLHEPGGVYLKVNALNPALNLYARSGFILQRFGTVCVLVRKAEN